ncbi:hypothetical protein NCCP2222_22960 [Sporosarcina sp. NCCP-2222]|nr:hypothetical protein NCCP2222_22960 [Sporosarcina sp. NCCP-2222]
MFYQMDETDILKEIEGSCKINPAINPTSDGTSHANSFSLNGNLATTKGK